MARVNKMSVLKRQRERKKAEKAALKREQRGQPIEPVEERDSPVATRDDLAGYGLLVDEEEEAGEA
jgi:hypothetical protein